MVNYSCGDLTDAQNELFRWIKDYMRNFQHSSWQEGKARTMQIIDEIVEGVPIMGSVAAGGLVETFSDVQENLDLSDVLQKKNIFALTVNGDSMIDACIADGDMVLMEPINDSYSLKNGTIVSAMVPGLGTTLKYFIKRGDKIFLEAANTSYEPIELNLDEVVFQGKLLAVWRKV